MFSTLLRSLLAIAVVGLVFGAVPMRSPAMAHGAGVSADRGVDILSVARFLLAQDGTDAYKPPLRGAPESRMGAASRGISTEGHRVALVIGNGAYQHLPRLENPVDDAGLIAQTLRSDGFQLIGGKAQTDLNRSGFEHAIREFGEALQSGSVGLFYYAGHGLQLRGNNYLVPIEANPETAADVDFELINAAAVLDQMEAAGSKLNIVILDACRNNPFGGRGFRDAAGGLAQMQAPRGTLISYATQPGNVAMDGKTGHSPYTSALAEAIRRPGLPILDVFNQVGLIVDEKTGGRQQPWLASSPLEGAFYFRSPQDVSVAPPVAAPAAAPSEAAELTFWQSIIGSGAAGDFEEYLRQFPQGRFAVLARDRLALLKAPPRVLAPASPKAEDFIFPGSDQTLLTGHDLTSLSCGQLEIARNEIFARKGRYFDRANLQQHFAQLAWYKPYTWNPVLSPVETENVKNIVSLEARKGCRR